MKQFGCGKKTLAWLCVAVMLLSMLPLSGFTLDSESGTEEIVLSEPTEEQTEDPGESELPEESAMVPEKTESELSAEDAAEEELPEESPAAEPAVETEDFLAEETEAAGADGEGTGNVCKIGETGYATISAALAAEHPGESENVPTEIVMIANSTENVTVGSGRYITLDLAGYVLKAPEEGGSVITNSGTLTIEGGTITGGSAVCGGGIYNDGTLTISGATISGNTVSYFGGGIYNSGTLAINGGSIIYNGASQSGGGIYNCSGGLVAINGGSISNNSANQFGGGIYNLGTVSVTDSLIQSNSGNSRGGGIFNGGTLAISGGSITNNVSNTGGQGGGVYNDGTCILGGTAEIKDNYIDSANNLYLPSGKTVTIQERFAGDVGVTQENTTLAFTDNAGVAYIQCFTYDQGEYGITVNGENQLIMGEKATSINGYTVEAISDQTYSGSAICPDVVVKTSDKTTTLVNNKDYRVSCTNNTNVGTATVTISGRGAYTGTLTTTFVITQKDIAECTVDAIAAQAYAGTALKPEISVKDGDTTLVANTDYTLSYGENINAGENAGSVTITGAGNYKGTKTVNFTIEQKALSVSGTTVYSKTYDTTTDATIETFGELTGVLNSDDVRIDTDKCEASFDTKDAGNSKKVTVKFTLTGADAGNYTVSEESTTAAISQKQLTVEGTAVDGKTYNGTTDAVIGIMGQLTGVLNSDDVRIDTDKCEASFDTKDAGNSRSVTVKYALTGDDAANYTVSDSTTCADIEKRTITVTPDAAQFKTYGSADPVLTYTYSGNLDGETPAFEGALSRVAGDDVTAEGYEIVLGTIALKDNVAFKASNYTLNVTEDVNFTITKRSVTLYSESASKVYDGTALTAAAVYADKNKTAVDSVFASEVSQLQASGSVTDVSDSPVNNTITFTGSAKYKESNYTISKTEGQLSITPATLTVTPKSEQSKTYDGTTASGIQYEYSGAVAGETPAFTGALALKDAAVNAGTYKIVQGTLALADSGTFKAANYTLGFTGSVDYTIQTRAVTLTSASDSKTYDGKPLTKDEVQSDGFIEGDGADYNVTGSQTDKGTSKNTFTYTLKSGTLADNYTITTTEGDLTVAAKDIAECTVTPIEGQTYAGKALEPEITVKDGDTTLVQNTDYTVSYADNTDAGIATVTVTGIGNYTGTQEANFTIAKRSVTLYSESASKVYDGTALTAAAVYADKNKTAVDSVFASEVSQLQASGSVTAVSDSPVANTITFTGSEKYKESNYAISKTEGQLSVSRNGDMTITGSSYHGVYDGAAHGQAAGPSVSEGTTVTYSTDGGTTWGKSVPTLTDAGTLTVIAKAENPNYTDAQCTYTITVTKREITFTSASATKIYDGTPLAAKTVDVGGQGFASGESVSYAFGLGRTDVGVASNAFTVTWDKAKESNYSVTCVYGALEVTAPPNSPVKVNTDALTQIQKKYQEESPLKTVEVALPVSQDVSSSDVEKIKEVTGEKKTVVFDMSLVVEIDGERVANAGSTNDVPISVEYSLDFTGKSDIQVYRVHDGGDPEEITETPNKAGEFAEFNKDAGKVIVHASKYSTYCIAYNEMESPSESAPEAAEKPSAPAPDTGDEGGRAAGIFGVVFLCAAGALICIRRKREEH